MTAPSQTSFRRSASTSSGSESSQWVDVSASTYPSTSPPIRSLSAEVTSSWEYGYSDVPSETRSDGTDEVVSSESESLEDDDGSESRPVRPILSLLAAYTTPRTFDSFSQGNAPESTEEEEDDDDESETRPSRPVLSLLAPYTTPRISDPSSRSGESESSEDDHESETRPIGPILSNPQFTPYLGRLAPDWSEPTPLPDLVLRTCRNLGARSEFPGEELSGSDQWPDDVDVWGDNGYDDDVGDNISADLAKIRCDDPIASRYEGSPRDDQLASGNWGSSGDVPMASRYDGTPDHGNGSYAGFRIDIHGNSSPWRSELQGVLESAVVGLQTALQSLQDAVTKLGTSVDKMKNQELTTQKKEELESYDRSELRLKQREACMGELETRYQETPSATSTSVTSTAPAQETSETTSGTLPPHNLPNPASTSAAAQPDQPPTPKPSSTTSLPIENTTSITPDSGEEKDFADLAWQLTAMLAAVFLLSERDDDTDTLISFIRVHPQWLQAYARWSLMSTTSLVGSIVFYVCLIGYLHFLEWEKNRQGGARQWRRQAVPRGGWAIAVVVLIAARIAVYYYPTSST